MANLVIDIGNSYTKIAVFEQDELRWAEHYKQVDEKELKQLLDKYEINNCLICSVKLGKQGWEQFLKKAINVNYFTRETATGIKNHYLTPLTLGLDRLAAVTAAHLLFPAKGNLIIDAGTCITYDWVDAGGNYYGGSISPGLNMRYTAMNHYTDALPLLVIDKAFNKNFGDDTKTAITSGVQNGVKYEINGFIESYFDNNVKPNIVLTGGDAIFLDTLLKNSIFAPYIKIETYLVLKGLNAAIQEHND
jgi:type III pantothenate kinase